MSDLVTDLEELAAFGGSETGMVRFAWTPEHREASEWLADRFEAAGLTTDVDAAGNVFGRWNAGAGPAVLVGSHIDTVPQGGRFDGALGVLAALEAVRILEARAIEPRRPIWIVSFMDEEGARFGTSLLGSRAFVGEDLRDLADRTDADGVTLREAMAAAGKPFEEIGAARGIDNVGSYLELHIEQGPVLDRAGIQLGVVTAIAGVLGMRARLRGEANHAGTTPMELRRDALVGAARAIAEIRDAARASEDVLATVGQISVVPGGSNVVPGECSFSIDARSASSGGFARAEASVRKALSRLAREEGLDLELREAYRLEPVPLDPELMGLIEGAARLEDATTMRLPSGAGHDAMVIGRYVPTGMLFVPSRGGISHSPEEFTSSSHCRLGSRVLARALELLVAG